MQIAFMVGFGGFLGACARYGISHVLPQRPGMIWPLATLIVNLLGSFLIGLLMAYVNSDSNMSPQLRLFLGAGVLGSFTTFSALAYDCVELASRGAIGTALSVMAANVAFGLLAVVLGAASFRLMQG